MSKFSFSPAATHTHIHTVDRPHDICCWWPYSYATTTAAFDHDDDGADGDDPLPRTSGAAVQAKEWKFMYARIIFERNIHPFIYIYIEWCATAGFWTLKNNHHQSHRPSSRPASAFRVLDNLLFAVYAGQGSMCCSTSIKRLHFSMRLLDCVWQLTDCECESLLEIEFRTHILEIRSILKTQQHHSSFSL